MKKLTIKEIIKRIKNTHGDIFDLSKFEYNGIDSKTTIICKIHGEFIKTPYKLINRGQGCPKCATIRTAKKLKASKEKILNEAKKVHSDRYNYSQVNYINYHTKIEILCKVHGSFWQTPANHISNGQGCLKCNKHIGAISENFFELYPEKKNLPTTLYFAKFKNSDEEFYKVGITTGDINKRFTPDRNIFDIEFKHLVKTTLYNAFIQEQQFKINFRKFQYIPLVKFQGWTECFKTEIYDIMFNSSG